MDPPARLVRRLLIANRGEIVARIVRTARGMGVTSIAVYSDADRAAAHVRCADEAYHLGGSAAAESYLDIAKIIALARRVNADAIHPGYGFLSENAQFAQACVDAGLVFIGPPAAAIRAMGSKSAAKAAMAEAGVPLAPGYHGNEQSAQRLADEARTIGFPLIIKASAGGGGKGMHVVNSMDEVGAALDSARRLARTAFGNEQLLLERYFPRARHVEVQVFADECGSTVSLFDRDCSVQRRHQKIVEEAPAPGLRDQVRAAMAQAAVRAAQAVGYVGAGTVEFLVDESQNFYFMEMNTRLQVEHPVTECITGVDLVEWQLRIARGERLPLSQEEIHSHGAAMEVRLYAEDPGSDYLPSVGRIAHLCWPEPESGLRLDVGYQHGDEVSPYYDPMLGKIIAWGASRAQANGRLRRALEELEVIGVKTNRALLISILQDQEFQRDAVPTDFLSRRRAQLRFADPLPEPQDLAVAALWCATRGVAAHALWQDSRGWRLCAPPRSVWRFAGLPGGSSVTVQQRAADVYSVSSGRAGEAGSIDETYRLLRRDPKVIALESGGRRRAVRIIEMARVLQLIEAGRAVAVTVAATEDSLQAAGVAEQGSLLTPLPGTVVAVHVRQGAEVARGAPLITVEAMKMEHTLTAPYPGTVKRILFAPGDRVSAGAILVELTASQP